MTTEERNTLIRQLARDAYNVDGDVEVDEEVPWPENWPLDGDKKLPIISEGDDNGAYVQAWVWVSFAGTPLDKEKEEKSTI